MGQLPGVCCVCRAAWALGRLLWCRRSDWSDVRDSLWIKIVSCPSMCDQEHPQLGSRLLVAIHTPMRSTFAEIENAAALLNYGEATNWTCFPQLGCWHAHVTTGDRVELVHSPFAPNALYSDGLATNFGLWSHARARWAKSMLWPELEDCPMHEILERRRQ
jgi:hypothetical protein